MLVLVVWHQRAIGGYILLLSCRPGARGPLEQWWLPSASPLSCRPVWQAQRRNVVWKSVILVVPGKFKTHGSCLMTPVRRARYLLCLASVSGQSLLFISSSGLWAAYVYVLSPCHLAAGRPDFSFLKKSTCNLCM
jgi:hypothetical protein